MTHCPKKKTPNWRLWSPTHTPAVSSCWGPQWVFMFTFLSNSTFVIKSLKGGLVFAPKTNSHGPVLTLAKPTEPVDRKRSHLRGVSAQIWHSCRIKASWDTWLQFSLLLCDLTGCCIWSGFLEQRDFLRSQRGKREEGVAQIQSHVRTAVSEFLAWPPSPELLFAPDRPPTLHIFTPLLPHSLPAVACGFTWGCAAWQCIRWKDGGRAKEWGRSWPTFCPLLPVGRL